MRNIGIVAKHIDHSNSRKSMYSTCLANLFNYEHAIVELVSRCVLCCNIIPVFA